MNKPAPSRSTNKKTPHAAGVAPPLQLRKQQFVREAIWDAATDLFAIQGFDETTVDDIARAAGVSRRSFFRYFSSKNDLMAQGIVSFAAALTDAIDACPRTDSLSEVFRKTVLQVAQQSAAYPRTRKIMQIAAKYPTAREAQLSRMAELQDRVDEAFARRCREASEDDLTPSVLAGLTLSMLGVTFQSWFEQGEQDISMTAEQVFATLDRIMSDRRKPGKQNHQESEPTRQKRPRTRA